MKMSGSQSSKPGLRAPALFCALLVIATPAWSQDPQQPLISSQPPPSTQPVPGSLELAKLIWSTMAAVDHANRSGNYSVLRDISAQGFQINNDPARLGEIFSGLRNARIDLSDSLLVAPTYLEAPQQVRADMIEAKGVFQLRPLSIYFDMMFQWEQGRWKLFGIDLRPAPMADAIGPDGQPVRLPAQQQPPADGR
jgi:hypothetical protein